MRQMEVGETVSEQLAGGQEQAYDVPLDAGDFIEIVGLQKGADIALQLLGPGGNGGIYVDSPTGREGEEALLYLAAESGTHRLKVIGVEKLAPSGGYELRYPTRRPAAGDDAERARAAHEFSLGEGARRDGNPPEAARHYAEALRIGQALSDLGLQADSHLRAGMVHEAQGLAPEAKEAFNAAAAAYGEAGRPIGAGIALNYLSLLEWQLGEEEEALRKAERALEIFRREGYRKGQLDALNNLAILRRRRGEPQLALNAYQQAEGLADAIGVPADQAKLWGTYAVLLMEQGRLPDAAERLSRALEVWTAQDDRASMAFTRTRLGDVEKRRGNLAAARSHLEAALELYRGQSDRRGEAIVLNGLGTVEAQAESFAKARERYEEALGIAREINNPRGAALIRLNLGRVLDRLGDAEGALAAHREVAAQLGDLDPSRRASNAFGTARALRDLGRLEEALEESRKAVEGAEALREGPDAEGLSMGFFSTKQHYFDLSIDLLARLHEEMPDAGYDLQAFEMAERRRARSLLDLLGEAVRLKEGSESEELLARERELQQALNEHARRLEEGARAGVGKDEEERRKQSVREAWLALERVRGDLRRERSGYASPVRVEPASTREVRRLLLDRNTTLLAYSLGEERSFLFRMTRNALDIHPLPKRAEIEAAVVALRSVLTAAGSRLSEQRRRELAKVSKLLLGPLEGRLEPGRRLCIVAEGALLAVPFAALTAPGATTPAGTTAEPRYLVEDHEIVYAPSASTLLSLRREIRDRDVASRQIAIFADPEPGPDAESGASLTGIEGSEGVRGGAGFPIADLQARLPYSREEAEAILELTQEEQEPVCYLGPEATKARVLSGGLGDFQILHFATHAFVNEEQPELSGLVLSPGGSRDGGGDRVLRLHEVYGLDLPAELVVLSACSTGLGAEVPGEGIVGLTRGFMYAGAPRVVVSLWNVADRSTAELMKRFYWALLERGAPAGVALQAAQISLLRDEDWDDPFHWAAFVLQGEWRRPFVVYEEPPIEQAQAGGGHDAEEDVDFPPPGLAGCDSLEEEWQQQLCRLLDELARPADRDGR